MKTYVLENVAGNSLMMPEIVSFVDFSIEKYDLGRFIMRLKTVILPESVSFR